MAVAAVAGQVSAAAAEGNTAMTVYALASPSVVVVDVLDAGGKPVALGSGVVIRAEQIITNCHVVAVGRSYRARQSASAFAAALLHADADHDLCLLSAPGLTAPPARRGDSRLLQVGQVVYAIGSPGGLELTISQGLVSSIREHEEFRAIQTSASMSPGSSGGGLFDEAGRLVGITTFSMKDGQNLNFAVPVEWIPGDTPQLPSAAKTRATASSPPRPPATSVVRGNVDADRAKPVETRKPTEPVGAASPNWLSTDTMYQVRVWSSYKTDPSTWSTEGGFGLRWGMGPGDVMRVSPELQVVVPDSAKESQVGIVHQKVQDLDATVFFRFYRGRLYEIAIDPGVHAATRTDEPFSMERFEQLREQRWKDGWKWRNRLRTVLQQGYGTPVCAPSDRTIAQTCDAVAPPGSGCDRFDGEKRRRLLRWVWRTPRTEVVLTGGVVPDVLYTDLTLTTVVRQAKAAANAEHARRKARGEAEDRARLAGQDLSPMTAMSPSPEIVHEATVPATIPPVECFKDDDEPSADATTQSTTWSAHGWGQFRWGMGPADVRSSLDQSKRGQAFWDSLDPDTMDGGRINTMDGGRIIVPGAARVFGADVTSKFHFRKDRLVSVDLSTDCYPEESGTAPCDEWARKVSAAYDQQCGRARCVKEGKYQHCRWDRPPDLWLRLSRYDGGAYFQALTLTFEDPALHPTRVAREAIKATAPRTWSKQGWNGFRWGMGIADAQRRSADPHGDLHADRELACYATREGVGVTECRLERDFHKLRISDQAPNVAFKFADGRLFSVELVFPEDIDAGVFWDVAERMRSTLAAKYGAPAEDRSSQKPDLRSLNLAWKKGDLRIWYLAMLLSRESLLMLTYEDPKPAQLLPAHGKSNAADSSKL